VAGHSRLGEGHPVSRARIRVCHECAVRDPMAPLDLIEGPRAGPGVDDDPLPRHTPKRDRGARGLTAASGSERSDHVPSAADP